MLFKIHPGPLHSTPTTRITLIRCRRRLCRKRTFKSQSGSSPASESSYNKTLVNPPAVGFSKLFIAKYIEKNLHKIPKTILEVQASPTDKLREKLLKARLPDIYYSNSHIEYYNFCQQYEDCFITTRVKGLICILFATSFLYEHINFCYY